jgi:hypothetical protein
MHLFYFLILIYLLVIDLSLKEPFENMPMFTVEVIQDLVVEGYY